MAGRFVAEGNVSLGEPRSGFRKAFPPRLISTSLIAFCQSQTITHFSTLGFHGRYKINSQLVESIVDRTSDEAEPAGGDV